MFEALYLHMTAHPSDERTKALADALRVARKVEDRRNVLIHSTYPLMDDSGAAMRLKLRSKPTTIDAELLSLDDLKAFGQELKEAKRALVTFAKGDPKLDIDVIFDERGESVDHGA